MIVILLHVRRWWLLGLILLIGLLLIVSVGAREAGMPGADGPRVVRQYLVVGLPCLAAPILIDQLSDISAALRRERRIQFVDQLFVVAGCFAILAVAWSRSAQSLESVAYEWFSLSALLCLLMVGTARWGVTAILVASLVAVAWFFAGDTIALILGFGELGDPLPGLPSDLEPRAWVFLALAATALPVSFGLGLSSRWRA